MKKEIIGLYALLIVTIILMLINKFPINIEMKENRQVWEANCNCKCEPQEAKPCWNLTWEAPKSFNVNYSWSKWLNTTGECRFCWIESATP